ncbi:hypothetical protein D3C81_1004930 [compost metagenome]
MHTLRASRRYLAPAYQAVQIAQAGAGTGEIVGDHHRAGFGDRQGEVVCGILAREIGEEVDDGVDLALAQQVETVPLDGGQQAVEVTGAAQLVDRFGVVVTFHQPVGGLPVQLVDPLGIALAQRLVEGAAQQGVETVDQAFAAALLDEQVAVLQLADQQGRVVRAAQARGEVGIEGPDHGHPFEKVQQGYRQRAQRFLAEVAGYMLEGLLGQQAQRLSPGGVRVVLFRAQAEGEENPADPALAAGAQYVGQIAVQQLSANLPQFEDFLAAQRQFEHIHGLQPLVAAQVAERQGGFPLAGGEQVQVVRRVVEQFFQVTAGRGGSQQVEVVENQGEAALQSFQMPDDGGPQPFLVHRRRRWQAERVMQVQEQGERLVVATVQSIPGPGRFQTRGVLGQQRALAIAQRRPDQAQQHVALRRLAQTLEQRRASEGRCGQARGTELVELEWWSVHRGRAQGLGVATV